MKLWQKISLLTAAILLISMVVYGGITVYETSNYNIRQTSSAASRQVRATAYALGQSLENAATEEMSDTARKAYLQFLLRRYSSRDYMLLQDWQLAANTTNFELTGNRLEQFDSYEPVAAFQQKNGRHLMIVGQKIPLSDSKNTSYQLLLVRDISEIYNNVLTQIGMFLIILGAIVAVAINAVFWMIRRMLKPLRDLRETAGAISQGQLDRRVRVRSNDEVGALSVSFNQMADQIECQMEELAQVSERRKQLLGSLAHELKTPMMAVQGCAEGIHTGVLDPVKASGAILEEAEQMSDLVEELLALSRLESGQANAEFRFTDIREVLYDCLRSTEQLTEQRKLCITPCFDEKPVSVNCDEVQLRRAFTNIITNALRYAKKEIQIECKADRGKAIVRIRDDGEGIAPELLPHIFDRFYSTRKGGAGIGLSLAKEIVSLHKGTISASNDGGALFEISLPLRKTI